MIKAPNGFRVKHRFYKYNNKLETIYFDLIDNTKPDEPSVGHVELERVGKTRFVTHSQLYSEYHGKGFGNLLYSKAIAWALNNGYKVSSSGDSSDMAKRVWRGKGLRKLFNIRKYTDEFYGRTSEKWFATVKTTKPVKKTKRSR